MIFYDLLHETHSAITSNKVRSGLTVLGIVIGIGSVISMISIGQGAKDSIQTSIQSIGSNLVIVVPGQQRGPGVQVSAGRGSAQSIMMSDADAISKQVASIKGTAPETSRRYQVVSRGKNTNTQVVGTVPGYLDVRNVQIDQGNFINDQQIRSLSKVAVIGPNTRDDLFGVGADPIGQTVRINKVDFKVIGLTVAKGGSGFSNPDDVLYVPISSAQKFLAGNDYVTTLSVAATDQESMTAVQSDITSLLLSRHHINNPALADFSVINQADIVATASGVASTFTILLGSVAGISLLVGGIGIMNMMLTTVTERTKEIGLRKAIGATRRDITSQFLVEAIVLTVLGGLFGILLGWLISWAVTYFTGITTSVSMSSIVLAFGVSAGIGILFGYYPARRAASLNPIQALRYE